MERSEKFHNKLKQLKRAIVSFKSILDIDASLFNQANVQDAINNGKIQKFEYTLEILWKCMKFFLEEKGAQIKFAKEVIKEFYDSGFVSEENYELLFQVYEDRNQLSHEYYEEHFHEILNMLPQYFETIKLHFEILEKNSST